MKLWYRHFKTQTSAIYALIGAGGSCDGAHPGIAHLTEHMLFRGTKNMPEDAMKYRAAKYGIKIGASTGKELMTFVAENILDVEIALDIVYEALTSPLFPETGLSKEKPTVVSEIKRGEDDNAYRAMKIAMARMVKYPFNVPNLGFAETLETITTQHLHDFHSALFTPDNITLCYAGALKIDEIVELCNENFGCWQPVKAQWSGSYTMPEMPSLTVNRRDQEQTHASLNFPGVAEDNEDYEKVDLLCSIIGGSLVGRMFAELRNEKGLCYNCGIRTPSFSSTPGVISFYGATPKKNTTKFISGVLEIINALLSGQKPITQDELDSAKARYNATLFNASDNLNSQLALFITTWKSHRTLHERIKLINALTINNLNDVARKYLSMEPQIIIIGEQSA